MKKTYFTITGTWFCYGTDIFHKKDKVKLIKEPKNNYDSEAIRVEVKGLGKVGYVANSPYTVLGKSISAGRMYDRIGKKARGTVVAVTDQGVLCKLTPKKKDLKIENEVYESDEIRF